MALHRYKVLRRLIGDKTYEPGAERIATPGDVAHLVPRCLEDLGPVGDEKAEKKLANKAEPAVKNKAEAPAKKATKADEASVTEPQAAVSEAAAPDAATEAAEATAAGEEAPAVEG